MRNLIPNLTEKLSILLKTRVNKLQDAWDMLSLRRTQLDRIEQKLREAELAYKALEEERDLAEIKHTNSIAELERVTHWTRCGSIHWFLKQFKEQGLTFQQLKDHILVEGLEVDDQFIHQLDYCISHPEDLKGEYKDYKPHG